MHTLSVSLWDLRTIPYMVQVDKRYHLVYCLNKIKEIMILILQNFRKPVRQTVLLIGMIWWAQFSKLYVSNNTWIYIYMTKFQLQFKLQLPRVSTPIPTPTPGVWTPTPNPASLLNINSNSNSNSGGFNSNSNSLDVIASALTGSVSFLPHPVGSVSMWDFPQKTRCMPEILALKWITGPCCQCKLAVLVRILNVIENTRSGTYFREKCPLKLWYHVC